MKPINKELYTAAQRSVPMSSMNNSVRPPQINSQVNPVHNYSIQTGEEFALEFMLDRVNLRKPLIPYSAGDPNYATGYMDLKGLLGISNTGSESGSDISMPNVAERGSKDLDRRNLYLYEEKSNHGTSRSEQRTSSGYDNSQGLAPAVSSSGSFGNSSTKMKILCSFNGRILPRPSDGRLRYVGGETRIININKDISWQELVQKTATIYDQAHTIKYQLPGEDLDALVSVSCDEDLQNMMEECSALEDGEGLKKLRIFLLATNDSDDAQFGLGSIDDDSEIQYIVAVNGVDIGSRKNSIVNDLAGSSYNLDELPSQNVNGEASRVPKDTIVNNTLHVEVAAVSSSAIQSVQPPLSGALKAYQTHPPHQDHQMKTVGEAEQHQVHNNYASHPFSYLPPGESPVPVPFPWPINEHGAFTGRYLENCFSVQDPKKQGEEIKLINVTGKVQPLQNDFGVPSKPYDSAVLNHLQADETSVSNSLQVGERPSFPPKVVEQQQDSVPASITRNAGQVPESNSEHLDMHGSGHVADPVELNNLEPPAVSQRVFYSERASREQKELLSRFSKSDDALGSQFPSSHSQFDVRQKDLISETDNKLHDAVLATQNDCSNSNAKNAKILYTDPQTVDNGPAQPGNHKTFVDTSGQKKMWGAPKIVDGKGTVHQDRIFNADGEGKENNSKILGTEVSEVKSEIAQGNSVRDLENPMSSSPEFDWADMSVKDVPQMKSAVHSPNREQGDILIDINDRFPCNILYDIFSKAILSESSSGIDPLHKDGAGLSLNVEKHEPKHWSDFQNLARGDIVNKDVSLIDQDYPGLSLAQTKMVAEAPMGYNFTPLVEDGFPLALADSPSNFVKGTQRVELPSAVSDDRRLNLKQSPSQVRGNEGLLFDGMAENLKMLDSENQEKQQQLNDVGISPANSSLVELQLPQSLFNCLDCHLYLTPSSHPTSKVRQPAISKSFDRCVLQVLSPVASVLTSSFCPLSKCLSSCLRLQWSVYQLKPLEIILAIKSRGYCYIWKITIAIAILIA
ncbi:PB1 domain [Dillenia turbinata]|uniref:PB1 domain n=1 Tax=Dillenia turbinata TaxID=194707 RepID=A0AAN8ZHQ8_9MAGN